MPEDGEKVTNDDHYSDVMSDALVEWGRLKRNVAALVNEISGTEGQNFRWVQRQDLDCLVSNSVATEFWHYPEGNYGRQIFRVLINSTGGSGFICRHVEASAGNGEFRWFVTETGESVSTQDLAFEIVERTLQQIHQRKALLDPAV